VELTVQVLPSDVAVANTQFTFYNCSARSTYEHVYQLYVSTALVVT